MKILIHGNALEPSIKRIYDVISTNLDYEELPTIYQLKVPKLLSGSCTVIRMNHPFIKNQEYGILNYY